MNQTSNYDAQLLSNSKKEAKRLLKLSQSNGLAINNLSDSQEVIAKLKGKNHWHELIKSTTQSDFTTDESSVLLTENYEHVKGAMQLGVRMYYKADRKSDPNPNYLALSPQQALGSTILFGDKEHTQPKLLSMATEAINDGSGLIYFSAGGRRSDEIFIKNAAKLSGRQDDVITISFMTANYSENGHLNVDIKSCNPFSGMSSKSIVSMISQCESKTAGYFYWHGAGIRLLTAIVEALCEIRESNGVEFGVKEIRHYLNFDHFINLSASSKIVNSKSAMTNYLNNSVGYDPKKSAKDQTDSALEHHGFLQMQFTKMLDVFDITYPHLVTSGVGDYSMKELLKSGKILIFVLPAIEKAPTVLRALPQFMLGYIKASLEELNGQAHLYRMIFEDIGYYSIDGLNQLFNDKSHNAQFVLSSSNYHVFSLLQPIDSAHMIKNCSSCITMGKNLTHDAIEIITRSNLMQSSNNLNDIIDVSNRCLNNDGHFAIIGNESHWLKDFPSHTND